MDNNIINWLSNWDFENNSNSYLKAHKIHRYPATFVPELAEKVITTFSNENDLVLDIFSGSGTTLLESLRLNRNVVGIELNPLAILISKVKTTYIPQNELTSTIEKWKQMIDSTKSEYEYINEDISIQNVEFWFSTEMSMLLLHLKSKIKLIENQDIQDFLIVCVSEIMREISFCNHSGFKLHRDKSKLNKTITYQEFMTKLNKVIDRNILANKELETVLSNSKSMVLFKQDSRLNIEELNSKVDLIFTSPPYGDSKTTVAYGQFSTFTIELFELNKRFMKNENISGRDLDNYLLGGSKALSDEAYSQYLELVLQSSATLSSIYDLFTLKQYKAEFGNQTVLNLDDKQEKDAKKIKNRLKDIMRFYIDLYQCINNASLYLKDNGYFVLVTASRVVFDVKLHTDLIIAEFAETLGFTLQSLNYRNIINKRMPSKVSSSNQKGVVSPTMTKETIIVLRKIK